MKTKLIIRKFMRWLVTPFCKLGDVWCEHMHHHGWPQNDVQICHDCFRIKHVEWGSPESKTGGAK